MAAALYLVHRHPQHSNVVESGRLVGIIQETALSDRDIPLKCIGQRQIGLRRNHRGLDAKGALARLLGHRTVTLLKRDVAEIVQSERRATIKAPGKFERSLGLVQLSERHQHGTERVVSTGRTGTAVHRSMRIAQGQLRCAPLPPQTGEAFE